MSKWHGGKGSGRRKNADQKTYEDNWDKIFGKKDDADLGLEGDTRDDPYFEMFGKEKPDSFKNKDTMYFARPELEEYAHPLYTPYPHLKTEKK